MEIRLAKTAGFCFGVNRAVELTYGLLNEGHKWPPWARASTTPRRWTT